MTEKDRASAATPDDLERLFVARANAADIEGLVALYEPDAVLATSSDGHVAVGKRQIRAALDRLLAEQRRFVLGEQQPALVSGDVALTTTQLANGGITVEVARRQPDGSWLWVIDRFNIFD